MTPETRDDRRRAPVPGCLLALAVLAAATLAPPPARADTSHVARADGAVEIGTGTPPVWRAATVGDELAPGDAVRTGRDGRAELALAGGTVRLYGNSLLRLPAAAGDGPERVRLDGGRSLFDVLHHPTGRFEVETPEVVVSVKGTRFGVDLRAAGAEVAVYRGLVGVRELGATLELETLVREGFAAVGGRDRPFELLLNGAADPWEGFGRGRDLPFVRNRAATVGIDRAAGAATESLERGDAAAEEGIDRSAGEPARRAVSEARAAARAAARPAAIERALEMDPALRERAEKLARQRIARKRLDGSDLAPPAKAGPGDGSAFGTGRDAPADLAALHSELKSSIIETLVLGAPNGPPGGAGPAPFTIDFVSGSGQSGPDQVVIQAQGASYAFTQSQLTSLVGGQTTLPGPLLTYLATNGVNGPALQTLVQQMLVMVQGN